MLRRKYWYYCIQLYISYELSILPTTTMVVFIHMSPSKTISLVSESQYNGAKKFRGRFLSITILICLIKLLSDNVDYKCVKMLVSMRFSWRHKVERCCFQKHNMNYVIALSDNFSHLIITEYRIHTLCHI